MNIEYIEDVDG